MQLRFWKTRQTNSSFFFSVKCVSIVLLVGLSILVVACGNNGNSQAVPGGPDVTVTIRLGQSNGSPTPPLPAYSCGAWVTDTSLAYSTNLTIAVYAKYMHNVNGNPEGVGGATGIGTVMWPDGSTDSVPATTSSDGLAVFPVVVKPVALNKVVTISVVFTNPKDGSTCSVSGDQAAYFTLVIVSPTVAKPSTTGSPSGIPTGTPGGTPTGTPGGIPTGTVFPLPSPTH